MIRSRPQLAAALLACVLAAGAALAIAQPARAGVSRARLLGCITSLSDGAAHPRPGSAAPSLRQRFGVFAATAPSPPAAAEGLLSTLGAAGISSYDPSRVEPVGRDRFLLPATIPTPTVSARCAAIPGFSDLVALRRDAGNGPGVCLLGAYSENGRPFQAADCFGLSALSGFAVAALATDPLGVPVPDGVTALTYHFGDGSQITVPVNANRAVVPRRVGNVLHQLTVPTRSPRAALTAGLPTEISASGPHSPPPAYRPPALIGELLTEARLFAKANPPSFRGLAALPGLLGS